MERAVGEVFELNGVNLQVVEQKECDDCFFWNNKRCTRKDRIDGGCGEVTRSNRDNVIFKKVKEEKKDDDRNPEHYYNAGIEPIHYMKANFSKEAYSGFLEGNIIKYVSRYKQKNGINDLIKASNYLKMLIDTLEESE